MISFTFNTCGHSFRYSERMWRKRKCPKCNMKKYNEVRLSEGKPDDIAIDGVDTHLEWMSDDNGSLWWLGLYKGKKRTTFHIWSKSKIKVELVENGLKSKIVK